MKTMDLQTFVSILVFVLICHITASEKALSIESGVLSIKERKANGTVSAEEAKPKSGLRSAKYLPFSDDSQQQDSRIQQTNHPMSFLYNPSQSAENEDGRMNFLYSMGHDGMQVGQDFKPPFFNAPPTNMLSALLFSPFLRSIFGSSNSPYDSTSADPSSIFHLDPRLSSGIVTAAALAAATFLFPKVTKLFSLTPSADFDFREGRGADNFFQKLNSVLGHFDIDGASCIKVAFCSLGKARKQERSIASEPTEEITYADALVDIMDLPPVKKFLSKRGFIQAQNFGESGGDCENLNSKNKCPIRIETFQKYFSSLK